MRMATPDCVWFFRWSMCSVFLLCLSSCTLPVQQTTQEVADDKEVEPTAITSFKQLEWKKGDTLNNARRVYLNAQVEDGSTEVALQQIPKAQVLIRDKSGLARIQTDLRFMAQHGVSFMLADNEHEVQVEVLFSNGAVEKAIELSGHNSTLRIALDAVGGGL